MPYRLTTYGASLLLERKNMPIFNSIDAIYLTVLFILPGFLIKMIVDLIVSTKKETSSKYIISCFFYSVLNFAIIFWPLCLLKNYLTTTYYYPASLGVTFGSSIVVAILIVVLMKSHIFYLIMRKMFRTTKTDYQTSWDALFSTMDTGKFIKVTLVDGESFNCELSTKSFASEDCDCNDIYFEKLFDTNWNETDDNASLYVAKNQIRSMKIYDEIPRN